VGMVVVGLLGVLALSGGLERGVGVAGADSAVMKVGRGRRACTRHGHLRGRARGL
jgi:hypothetical protein